MGWRQVSKANVRLGERQLAKALASSYPSLSATQLERLEEAIIREVAAAISRGDSLAILRPLSDGSWEISRMVVERAARAAAIQK
jgi:hypothetical protein